MFYLSDVFFDWTRGNASVQAASLSTQLEKNLKFSCQDLIPQSVPITEVKPIRNFHYRDSKQEVFVIETGNEKVSSVQSVQMFKNALSVSQGC